jgi:hypothetical protein
MGGIRFNPRDMIMPPFKTCPKCGKTEFGVHGIHGDRVLRRCRDCWYHHNVRLPPIHKKIIYLDQFVISEFAKLKNPAARGHEKVRANPFWQQAYDLLFQLRQLQMICCPDSWSHQEESRISSINADLKKMYENLSGGITFGSFDGIKSMQIAELARSWVERREPVFDFNARRVLSSDPNEWNQRYYITFQDNPFVIPANILRSRKVLHGEIARLFTDVWGKQKRTFDYWYNLERTEYQKVLAQAAMKSQRERWEVARSFQPDKEMPLAQLDKIMPSFAETLLGSILHIFQFPREGGMRSQGEIAALMKGFKEANPIADAPFLKLQALMYSVIATRAAAGQKSPPNEGMATDIDTVAHILPYSDAMFVDNECRALLLNIPKRLQPTWVSRVYSMRVKDDFLAFLREIRNSITREHLIGLREAYGDRDLTGVPGAQPERT